MTSSIVILTGAGISAESGIQTFRGAGGLWEGHQVGDVATPEGFTHDPELAQRFYDERRLGRARLRRIWRKQLEVRALTVACGERLARCFRAWLTSFLRWALDPDEK